MNSKTSVQRVPPPGEVIRIPPKMAGIEISRLPLSTRLSKALRDHGIEVLGHLQGKTFEDFHAGWNFGAKTEQELKKVIQSAQIGRIGRAPILARRGGLLLDRDRFQIPAHSRHVAVSTLDISARLAGGLERMQIRRLGDLAGCVPADFLSHANFGRISLVELQALVRQAQSGQLNPSAAELDLLRPVDIVPLLDDLLGTLERRDAVILHRRLGASGNSGQSLHLVGTSLGLTRERIRQVIEESLDTMRKKGGPKFGRLIARIAADCDKNACPLSSALLEAWLRKLQVPRKFSVAFYVRLLAGLTPELPIWLDEPPLKGNDKETGEAVCAALTALLQEGSRAMLLKNAFASLRLQRKFKRLSLAAFVQAVRCSPTLSVDFSRPDKPVVEVWRD